MILLILINFFLIFVSSTISQETVQWNLDTTTRIAVPLVREYSEPWTSRTIQNQFSHYKTHFEIIIKGGTTFNLTLETSSKTENLYFYCLADSPYEKLIILNLAGETNFTKTLTTNFDCVPMVSVSNNVPLRIIIETKNWLSLPIFDSNDASLFESEEFESKFYKNIQIYGFVENYYTQMLLSVNDIKTLKSLNYSLYLGLENQIDIIEYYDYLTGISPYYNEDIISSLKLIDRTTIFIRSEKCNEDNSTTEEYLTSTFECEDISLNFVDSLDAFICPETNLNRHFISTISNVQRFLQPKKGSSWILLQKFAEYYNRKEFDINFRETFNLWNDMFATLYHQKFVIKNPMLQSASPYNYKKILNYQMGNDITKWSYEEKLNLFVSLFGYDGTDTNLREFRIRHNPYNQITTKDSVDIVPTILKMFLDLYDINLLPFLKKIIKDISLNPELKLRLLNEHPVMPAIDFGINPKDLRALSKERDLRQISPLMLGTRMKNTYVNVLFIIESPIDLTNCCLYLNNDCHTIVGKNMTIKLLSDVYSIYVAEVLNGNTYISDEIYHTISKNMLIIVDVKEIPENQTYLPLIHYRFDAQGPDNRLFLEIFINYKDMTLIIKQLSNEISENNLYFLLQLKRNDTNVMEYKFPDKMQNQLLTNAVEKFEINDEIHIFHCEPNFLKLNLNGYNNPVEQKNIFRLTSVGLDAISKKIENNLKYEFNALNHDDILFLKIFINYNNMTIKIKQFNDEINKYYKNELYFSFILERNDTSIFKYKFFGSPQNNKSLVNDIKDFKINDKIHIYHTESHRLMLNLEGYFNVISNNSFILTNEGLRTIVYKDIEIYNFLSILAKKSLHNFNYRGTELNKLNYSFEALRYSDKLFLKIFINYTTMTIELNQLIKDIHWKFKLYFSISLERNGASIFEYKFFGTPKKNQKLINVMEKFKFNDIIRIYHVEPSRLKLNLEGFHNNLKNNSFLLSNIGMHNVLNKQTELMLRENKFYENETFLPIVEYVFDALGLYDSLFLKIFFNYKTMTIELKRFGKEIHRFFKNSELYFSMRLEHKGVYYAEYNFFGGYQPITNTVVNFEINDRVHFYHVEGNTRFKMYLDGYSNSESRNHTFVLTDEGLREINDLSFKIISSDIKRIDKFNSEYNIDLSYNALYQNYFANYIRTLRFNDLEAYIPLNWL
ncbi:uncharacterized protein LOC127286481 [Leptopilina boulardi]|uniref:uncharacterized protein LOC127286481 n=1 Tax=Leptopilina boulardi TaxID=63433 RepID=UPI0021F57F81|nr:uncharacterized protein LOC127286481 [Leptopilina boulardi]